MKRKIYHQDGGHLTFPIGTILAIFDLQVTPMLPAKFKVNKPSGSGEQVKKIFSRWPPCGYLGFPIGTILAIFDLQVTPMLSTKFRVNWPFGSGEEAKNRISRWRPWRPSWISDRNNFSYFLIYNSPQCFLPSIESTGPGCRGSRLLNQLLAPHDGRRTTDDGH